MESAKVCPLNRNRFERSVVVPAPTALRNQNCSIKSARRFARDTTVRELRKPMFIGSNGSSFFTISTIPQKWRNRRLLGFFPTWQQSPM